MNKVCRMGENYAFIKPNGDVERCCKDHSLILGNVIKGTFKFMEEPMECSVEDCYCWRRMLVGEDNLWSKYWSGMWDRFYYNKIKKLISDLNNNLISSNKAYEKHVILKQKIYDKNTKKACMGMWDQYYFNRIKKLMSDLDNNLILYKKTYEKLKQKIYDENTKKACTGIWDACCCDKIRKIIIKLNNNELSFDEACEKYFIFKQQIYDKKTREEELDVLENNIITNKLSIGWKYLQENKLELAKENSDSLLKYYYIFNSKHKIDILMYMSRMNIILKDFEKVRCYLLQIKKIDEYSSEMYKLLAMVEFELHNYSESKINFKKAIRFARKNNNKKDIFEAYFEIVVHIKRWCNINNIKNEELCKYNNIINKLQKKMKEYKL